MNQNPGNILSLEPGDIKLCIAMVSHDMVPVTFAYDLANLSAYTAFNMPEGMHFGTNLISGTYVHAARNKLMKQLIRDGVTHILWIDTDMRFPRDAFIRLLERKKPVIGINYAKREVDTSFVAFKKVGWELGQKSEHLFTGAKSTGVEEVEGIGFGMVLMRTAYLRGIPMDKPWFWFESLGQNEFGEDCQMGEDIYFCRLLREHGVPIYVDQDLSKECKHTGFIEYECSMAEMFHEERKEKKGLFRKKGA